MQQSKVRTEIYEVSHDSTSFENTSGLTPLGHGVLLRPYEPVKEKSLIVIPDTVGKRQQMLENRAVVIAIGPECWKDEASPRAKPGDRVMISQFAGAMVVGPKDGIQYRQCNANDIHTLIDDDLDR